MRYFPITVRLLCLGCALLVAHATEAIRPVVRTHEVTVQAGEEHQGVRFPPGTVLTVYSESGAIAGVLLHQDFRLNGHLLKSGSTFQLYEDGKLLDLDVVRGQAIGTLIFEEGEATVRFDRNGRVQSVRLRKPMLLQGIRFGTTGEVEFHDNGNVARGYIDAGQTIQGLRLKSNSRVSLYPTGKLDTLALEGESTFQQLVLTGDSNPANPGETQFWPDGSLKQAILARPAEVCGFPCASGPISFYESGKVRTLVLAREHTLVFRPYEGQAPVTRTCEPGDVLNLKEDGEGLGLQQNR